MPTLFDLTDQFKQLLQQDEIDLTGIVGDIQEKLQGYCVVRAELKGESDKFKAEIDRLSARKTTIDNNVKRLQDNMIFCLAECGVDKIKTGTFTVSIQNNPKSLVKEEGIDAPSKYMVPQPDKVDNTAIRKDIKAGIDVEGYSLESLGSFLKVK